MLSLQKYHSHKYLDRYANETPSFQNTNIEKHYTISNYKTKDCKL